MINTVKLNTQLNPIGSATSTLCPVHCLATPFLFVAHTGHVHNHLSSPFWWRLIDLPFVGISFSAVFGR